MILRKFSSSLFLEITKNKRLLHVSCQQRQALLQQHFNRDKPLNISSSSLELLWNRLPPLPNRNVKHCVVAMSGGLDSMFTAYLMKYFYNLNVEAMFMHTWDIADDEISECNVTEDADAAKLCCDEMDMPFSKVNLVKEYWNDVFEPFVAGYSMGYAPNPDLKCNQFVKFGKFMQVVDEKMKKRGIDKQEYMVATGHYARLQNGRLYRAMDPLKDQSFFLASLDRNQLDRAFFPLGNLLKEQVRQVASELPLFKDILTKPESMGICMIGKRKLSSFLPNYLIPTPGRFILFPSMTIIGEHDGAECFTLGQIARIPSHPAPPRLYVIEKGTKDGKLTGDIFVVDSLDHPYLWTSKLVVKDWKWMDRPYSNVDLVLRTHSKPIKSRLVSKESGYTCHLSESAWIVGRGQSIVAYDGDECVGTGIVSKPRLLSIK